MLFGYLGLIQSLPNGSGNDFRGFLERILWKGHASSSHAMRLATVFLNPFKMQLGIPPLHGEKGTGFIFFPSHHRKRHWLTNNLISSFSGMPRAHP